VKKPELHTLLTSGPGRRRDYAVRVYAAFAKSHDAGVLVTREIIEELMREVEDKEKKPDQ
jgi:hypothetical protein